MGKILLDYVFPITQITPTPQASTAFLKQACIIAKPKAGQEGNVGTLYECVLMSEVAARTDNTNAQQLFNAGMSKVFILLSNTLTVDLTEYLNQFFTLIASDDFADVDFEAVASKLVKGSLTFTADVAGVDGDEISIEFLNTATAGAEVVTVTENKISVAMQGGVSTATQLKTALDNDAEAAALISVAIASGQGSTAQAAFAEDFLELGSDGFIVNGGFDGVTAVYTQDADVAQEQAAITDRVAFKANNTNKAKNMCFAFGKLLSNLVNWTNQQYIPMPFNDGIDVLGEANSLFDDKVSFVINDDEFSNRLALFAASARAIVAPYILKNLEIDLQSKAVQWISGNQPQYTLKEASLLETRLQEDVINSYILRNWIAAGIVQITLVNENFVASGAINVSEPKALWRVYSEMRQTL